jgi:rRNA maturation endonuclease Nob1
MTRKSKKYLQYYGKPYVPKTLTYIKVCSVCGRQFPYDSKTRFCPYCSGSIVTKTIIKKPNKKGK